MSDEELCIFQADEIRHCCPKGGKGCPGLGERNECFEASFKNIVEAYADLVARMKNIKEQWEKGVKN